MNDLSSILGGGQQQSQLQDFVNRYQQGSPTDGYSDQEAVQHYQQVATKLPPQEFQSSAQQALEQLTPQQRMELGQELTQSAQQQGVQVPGQSGNFADAGSLAQMVTSLHQQSPGLLPQLLGGGGASSGQGGMLSSPIAKAAVAGIAAMAAQRLLSRR